MDLLRLIASHEKNDDDDPILSSNLNKATDVSLINQISFSLRFYFNNQDELKLAKQKMSVKFEENRLKPGDEGYEWDKQVDFSEPQEDCDWDEDG